MIRISVCIPTYNGERFIAKQLASILGQLSDQDEVIVSDDSSTDRTIEIIEGFKDNRIKIFKDQTFRSPIFNLENAILNCNGKYIFLSDQDDVWCEDKVFIFLKHLESNDMVISDCQIVNEEDDILVKSFFEINRSGKGFVKNLMKNGYLGCCMAFNRRVLNLATPFPPRIAMHDIWLGSVASIFGRLTFIDDKLTLYRRHGFNFSPTSEKSSFSLTDKINYRIYLLIHILKRVMKRSFNNSIRS